MLEIIQSGGPLMIPLIICGLLSVGLSVERFLVLNSLPDEEESKEELENLEKALLQEGQESAVQICENGKGALNFVFASLLKRYNTLIILYDRKNISSSDQITNANIEVYLLSVNSQNLGIFR